MAFGEYKEFYVNAKKSHIEKPVLMTAEDGVLVLTDGALTLCADFENMQPRLTKGRLNSELLVKAAKIRRGTGVHSGIGTHSDTGDHSGIGAHSDTDEDCPLVLDATAGLGEDSFLLAAAGFKVLLYEYNPVIAALLRDGLRRAIESDAAVIREAAERMTLYEENSLRAMTELSLQGASSPDVILLDPMFPERSKSALVKKKFQLLQQLESPCANGEELLSAAVSCHPHKIIIKRPLKGPYLGDIKPSYSITGKAIRYDVII